MNSRFRRIADKPFLRGLGHGRDELFRRKPGLRQTETQSRKVPRRYRFPGRGFRHGHESQIFHRLSGRRKGLKTSAGKVAKFRSGRLNHPVLKNRRHRKLFASHRGFRRRIGARSRRFRLNFGTYRRPYRLIVRRIRHRFRRGSASHLPLGRRIRQRVLSRRHGMLTNPSRQRVLKLFFDRRRVIDVQRRHRRTCRI